MKFIVRGYHCILSIIIFVLCMSAIETDAAYKNSLHVTIDVSRSELSGVSGIDVTAGQELVLHKGALEIGYIKLNGKNLDFTEHDFSIKLIPNETGLLQTGFRGLFRGGDSYGKDYGPIGDVIDERGVSLTGRWYPVIDGLSYHDLTARVPKGYEVISEADEISRVERDGMVEFRFSFPYPVDAINLVASNRYRVVKDSFDDIGIYAYFFEEDLELAKTYIEFTKKYLRLYEDLIGAYPYKRFSIVENFLPTGYSMPTYTLLGNAVIRLPFITRTSLGHEILHQWFGNSVYIDYESGNWAEGLTSYLADHLYREMDGKGWEYRKQILIDYKNYVSPEKDFPLKDFRGRSNHSTRAVGYGKTAMVFHMLKKLLGENRFNRALRLFISENEFALASWDDLRAAFEKTYDKDLGWFFGQWLDRTGLPELGVEEIEINPRGGKYKLHFHINHKKDFYRLKLPVSVYSGGRKATRVLNIDEPENSFTFLIDKKPERIVIDENYDIARELDADEYPPVIGRLLGEECPLVVLPPDREGIYKTIIDKNRESGATIKNYDQVTESDTDWASLIILGYDNPLIKKLFGKVDRLDAGFSIELKENPWNSEKVVAIINAESEREVEAAFRKISHYGKYSRVLFNKGRRVLREISGSDRGIVMELSRETPAVEISKISTLRDVIERTADSKIIYAGEMHTSFSHHAVQLDVIKGVYKKNHKVAIGMEMFQRHTQDVLDSYISGEMGEREFLRNSEYYDAWRYEYNLYKPILDFAREKNIPVIALNQDRQIIKKVSAGGIDSLSDEEKGEIPGAMDFSDREYRESLREIFGMHEGSSDRKFNYFYQSQILWDETMSMSIDEFLQKNPDYQIVVLAGQGHFRYGPGIPGRTFRRNGYDYTTILADEEVRKGIADYVVFPDPVQGQKAPKMMVLLSGKEKKVEIVGFAKDSISEKAGLKTGDVILALDNVGVSTIIDIKIHLQFKHKGERLKVKVMRKIDDEDKIKEFEFDL